MTELATPPNEQREGLTRITHWIGGKAVVGTSGRTGPVFNPARVLWDRWLSDAPTMLPTPPEGLPVVRSWPG